MLLKGRKGRPSIDISSEQLILLHQKGCTAKDMAKIFQCSVQLVYKRLYAANIHQRDKYASITNHDLQEKVSELHTAFPSSGVKVHSVIIER